MKVVQVTYAGGKVDCLRDPKIIGLFLRGVHCNEHGIGVRQEGCSQEAEMAILLSHIEWAEEVTDMTKAKPLMSIEIYKKVTKVRRKEKWGVRIKAGNNFTVFSSEKYVNHAGARNAADLIASGRFTVIDVEA